MDLRLRAFWLACFLIFAGALHAQNDTTMRASTVGPPIQRIATASGLSTERLGAIMSVRELADGHVLVNDGIRRRLLLFDSTLQKVQVVLDSLSDIANTYGPRPGALIPYRGDTTFFVDPASYAIVVLDENARIVRVRSIWRVQDIPAISSFGPTPPGWPGGDPQGRIIFRIPAQAAPPRVPPPSNVPYFPPEPDSAFVVAVNLDTRRLDTLGVVRVPRNEMRVRRSAEGRFMFDQVINPLPSTDEWALLPDGTVAFVRGRDYRIEYLHPDKRITSSAKLPFDWQRLNDDDKQRLVDSTRSAQQRSVSSGYVTEVIRWVNLYGRGYPKDFKVPEGYVPPPGLPQDWTLPPGVKFPANYTYACPPGVEPTAPAVFASGPVTAPTNPGATPGALPCVPAPVSFSTGGAPPPPTPRSVFVVDPFDLPDYRPPFPRGSVRADMDGNLWIRTNPMKPAPGGPVFDIVNPKGELANRIQLPPGYSVVGFGRGKIVYLSTRDATGIHLARVRLK